MKLIFARRALREIERNVRWWVEHRDAKGLFEGELAVSGRIVIVERYRIRVVEIRGADHGAIVKRGRFGRI